MKNVDINKYLLARGDNAVGSPEHYNISNATKGIGDLGSKIREYFAKGNKELKVVVGLAERGEWIFRSVNEASYYALKGYWGKACPEELQITLQLVLRFGITDELGLQRYCDEATDRFAQGRIGLDCNGFVGNFLQHAAGGASWNDNKVGFSDYPANNGIRGIMGKLGPELKRSADLDRAQTYVLGLANPTTSQVINQYEAPYFAHIMVTTPYSRTMKLDGKNVWE